MMGNRGILHDDQRRIIRSSQVRRWITCVTEYKGIRRPIMQPHRWTQLFFLDEAAAFSAGHRPCAFCRSADYKRFCSLWRACIGEPVDADSIDRQLHQERRTGRAKRTYREALANLPDGSYVAIDGSAWLVWGDALLAWSAGEYSACRPRSPKLQVEVLTPPSIVAVFNGGYRPCVHPSALKPSA